MARHNITARLGLRSIPCDIRKDIPQRKATKPLCLTKLTGQYPRTFIEHLILPMHSARYVMENCASLKCTVNFSHSLLLNWSYAFKDW